MPGVSGAGGPVPKRSDQRRRKNKVAEPDKVALPAVPVGVPPADEGWHPIARAWFESLEASGQSRFYEPSDWQTAFLLAESMSRELKPQFVGLNQESGEPVFAKVPIKGTSLSSMLKAMTSLLVTEGDRRRARLELERGAAGAPASEGVADLDDYRRRLAN